MVNPKQLYTPLPLEKDDLKDNQSRFEIAEDTLQLQVDALNVLEKRVDINSFEPEYQQKIRNYYRFSATRMNSESPKVAMRTNNTLDIV